MDTVIKSPWLAVHSQSIIASLLLLGIPADVLDDSKMSKSAQISNGSASQIHLKSSANPLSGEDNVLLWTIAIRACKEIINRLKNDLVRADTEKYDCGILYRELLVVLQDLGNLVSIAPELSVIHALGEVAQHVALSINMIAAHDSGCTDISEEDILESLTHFYGGLLASQFGMLQLVSAFEDAEIEHAWVRAFLDEPGRGQSTNISELRRAPGVLSWGEEVQRTSSQMIASTPLMISKTAIGTATMLLVDVWRTSQTILQLPLSDIEQLRRQSDTISQACLGLAKSCIYDAGREVKSLRLLCTYHRLYALPSSKPLYLSSSSPWKSIPCLKRSVKRHVT